MTHLRVVIAGYGNAGQLHATLLANRANIRIVGVADPTAKRRHAAAARHPHATIADSLDQLAVQTDMVVICTPPAHHERDTYTALTQHRAHVLCEKPAVLNPSTGRQLAKLATEAGRVLYPVHNYLYSPAIAQLQALAAGTIGQITHVSIEVVRTHPATGHADWHPAWRTDPTAGGGILYDHGPHACYLVCHLTGQRATSLRCTTTPGEHGADHHAQLHLHLTNGCTAAIRLSWNADNRSNSYQLHGEQATAELRNGQLSLVTASHTRIQTAENHSAGGPAHVLWTRLAHDAFLHHLHSGNNTHTHWESAVHVADILEAAHASANHRAASIGDADQYTVRLTSTEIATGSS